VARTMLALQMKSGECQPSQPLVENALVDLRRRLRSYVRIHVICGNASFHKSKYVREYFEGLSHRIEVNFLPVYSPETNPIERVWWHLHETITRNHRCQSIDELASIAFQ
jgi:putative transposase